MAEEPGRKVVLLRSDQTLSLNGASWAPVFLQLKHWWVDGPNPPPPPPGSATT